MSGGSFGEMGNILRQAQQMQREMDRVQRELKESILVGSAGGGAVKVEVDGSGQVRKVTIDPETLQGDVESLEEMVLAATRDGIQRATELRQTELSKVSGGLNLPGLF